MPTAPLPARIAALERPDPSLLRYYVLKAIAATVAFPIVMPLLYFRYHTMRYRFDDEGIHMRWGILVRREVMLNYSKIQDIQLHANLFERWLGLARLEIQTASGSAGAQMTLEGLLDFVEIRDFLYSRMRGARHGTAVSHAAGTDAPSITEALLEVARELRAIRDVVTTRAGHGPSPS